MANILEPIKNTKNLKSLLTNLLHRGPLETTSGAAGWAALLRSTLGDNVPLSGKNALNVLV